MQKKCILESRNIDCSGGMGDRLEIGLQSYLRDIPGWVPEHHKKVNITRKRLTYFLFPSSYKSNL